MKNTKYTFNIIKDNNILETREWISSSSNVLKEIKACHTVLISSGYQIELNNNTLQL